MTARDDGTTRVGGGTTRVDNDYRTIAIGLLNRWVLDGLTQEEKQRRTDVTWRVMEELEVDRDDGATRGEGNATGPKLEWRKATNRGVYGESAYELADGTARIVKLLDIDSNRQVWWAWFTDPESDLERFRTLREAKQYIEKLLDGRQQ